MILDLDITAPVTDPTRDRWGRPLIVPAGGGKPVPYMRATTLAGTCEDTYNLSLWQQRMVADGLSQRPDLLLAAAAHRGDRSKLNEVCEKAIEAARGGAGAITGTALHTLTDQLDRGTLDVSTVPEAFRADIRAFGEVTAALEVVGIECFGVLDKIEVAGTCDRIYRHNGALYIGDTKSGSIDWGAGKIAVQLALYSRMTLYDPATGTRGRDLSVTVDQNRAIVVHLPAGTGKAELMWVDIESGWASVALARKVRDWRKASGWLTPWTKSKVDPIARAIAAAPDSDSLTALWSANRETWTDLHTDAAKARRAVLTPAQS